MPVQRTALDPLDVVEILTSKGYGVNRNQAYGIQLTVKGKRQFQNGSYERELLKPVSKEDWRAILERCETKEEAALKVESVSLGHTTSAVEETSEQRATTGLTAEQLAHIIDNSTKRCVDQEIEPFRKEIWERMTQIRQMLDEAKALLAKAPTKRPVGRPPKNKSKAAEDKRVDELVQGMNIPKGPPADPQ